MQAILPNGSIESRFAVNVQAQLPAVSQRAVTPSPNASVRAKRSTAQESMPAPGVQDRRPTRISVSTNPHAAYTYAQLSDGPAPAAARHIDEYV